MRIFARRTQQEEDDCQLALFQARKEVEDKKEAKKKAVDLLNSAKTELTPEVRAAEAKHHQHKQAATVEKANPPTNLL